MGNYRNAFEGLNSAQRLAVETIEGPVLVIAGPGTGKTQLLSVRVAHILEKTDTLPQGILCLTFTESGAENMRERLTRFIGQSAYDVNIGTYHSFGGDLISRFPEVFAETRLQAAADELTKRQILRTIIESLPFGNPLKQVQHHLGDLMGTISEVKRALLDAQSLRAIARENAAFITVANGYVERLFAEFGTMPRSVSKALPLFEELLLGLQKMIPATPVHSQFGSLASIASGELVAAIETASESGKTNALTVWKNAWLAKDADNKFIFNGALANSRIDALADVFEQYEAALAENGWYDFDDMILRAIQALEQNPDLRYSLQEQYLYILLDEFQDTNAAQLKLVELLSDSPVHEGRPNVLAVGDDDQAIYAFQGAQYSNMLDFHSMYRDVTVVNLVENYRSSADILQSARKVATQIEGRLEKHFADMSKELTASNPKLPERADMERREFLSDVAQYDWIAKQVHTLIEQGTAPSEIAVLAPKHRQLEPLVPYLAELEVPMRYEKRENILEAPVVTQLLTMSKLLIALQSRDSAHADALWPQVLSYDFWNIPTSELWKMSWSINDAPRDERKSWAETLLTSDKPFFQLPAQLLLTLAPQVETTSLELMLDYLIGTEPVETKERELPDVVRSPLREYYTGKTVQHTNPELFYDTISHLTVLRAKLRDYATTQTEMLTLQGLLDFVEMYEAAEERMLNTSPYNQQADAVQLMTVFKAKGLEFTHVFLPSMQDDVWGSSSRGNTNKLTLPQNLSPIRHAGATDDERLRILFVAITRAKIGLHMTSFAKTYTGKATKHLKYLDEQDQGDGSFRSMILPEHAQEIMLSDHSAPTLASLELNWRKRHVASRDAAELKSLLADRLARYQLSPTHLTRFIDLEYGGPDTFFFESLLRFPQAPTVNSQFGDAMHATLEWVQHRVAATENVPALPDVVQYFTAQMSALKLTDQQLKYELERGKQALKAYLSQRGKQYRPTDKAEHNFRKEGVFIGDAHLSGKVDRLEIDHKNKTITVIDYKTGHSSKKWSSDARLHKYQIQLYCYKLLIENSHTYRGYTVPEGRIEFVEPDSDGRICMLPLTFDSAETERVKHLIQALWQRIHSLDFPDVTGYQATLAGIKQFEADLIASFTDASQ